MLAYVAFSGQRRSPRRGLRAFTRIVVIRFTYLIWPRKRSGDQLAASTRQFYFLFRSYFMIRP